jgi:CDGSH-type Zn-finger protein
LHATDLPDLPILLNRPSRHSDSQICFTPVLPPSIGYTYEVASTRSSRPAGTAEVTIYPDGPMLLRGDFEIVQADGTPLERRRRVVALCRCGHSALNPLCDGTHKLIWRPGKDNPISRRLDDDT